MSQPVGEILRRDMLDVTPEHECKAPDRQQQRHRDCDSAADQQPQPDGEMPHPSFSMP